MPGPERAGGLLYVMSKRLKSFIIERIYKSHSVFLNKLGVLILSLNQQRKLGFGRVRSIHDAAVTFEVRESIPPLAWISRVTAGGFHFIIGRQVEFSGTRLVEGVWDGDFATSKLEESECVFGSGAVIGNGRAVFVPPKHYLECLYLLHDKLNEASFVSNSLCFILESAGIDLDGSFFQGLSAVLHDAVQTAAKRGIDRYDQVILENDRYALYKMMFYNFSVDTRGRIGLRRQLPKRHFRTFGQYRSFLSRKLSELLDNASCPARKMAYSPITTITRGYDSPAVAVLARENGCREALTLDVTVYGVNDSGARVGELLGLDVHSYSHVMSDSISDLRHEFYGELKDVVLEFLATGGVGDDVTYYPFRDRLPNRVLLSGSHGGTAWTRGLVDEPGFTSNYPTIYMHSISEYRLRVAFCYLPVPVIGARMNAPVEKITNSRENEPYSIGGEYDRPIPRRIVEEAGVPRAEFGMAKCATAPLVTNHRELFREAVEHVMARYRDPRVTRP